MNREQWENLAQFAGITVEPDGIDINGLQWYWSPELDKHWSPDVDWADFGPLWVKLERWNRSITRYFGAPENTRVVRTEFEHALYNGTEQELMQAGCALGAAIGAAIQAGRKG